MTSQQTHPTNDQLQSIRNGMKDTLTFLQKSESVALNLFKFLSGNERIELSLDKVMSVLENCNVQIQMILDCRQFYYPMGPNNLHEKSFEIEDFDDEFIEMFLMVYYSHFFRMFSEDISIEILMLLNKFMAFVGTMDESVLFKHLLDFRALLNSLNITTFKYLKEEMSSSPIIFLENLVQLGDDFNHLYQYLKIMIQEPDKIIEHIYNVIPNMDEIMFMFAVRMFTLGEEKCAELFNLTKVFSTVPAEITLTVIAEPPKKTVYKKNLLPSPTVLITGDTKGMNNLTLDALLVRCDDFTELPKKELIGETSKKVTSKESEYTFKCKIFSTSRQLGDTFVLLRFELRHHHGDSYDVLCSTQTQPIEVVSHSTLVEKKKEPPDITDMVPSSGTAGTRVVILGSGFASPYLCLRIGNHEIQPIIYGEKTLIAMIPQIQNTGVVNIQVTNDRKKWSTPFSFYYLKESQQ